MSVFFTPVPQKTALRTAIILLPEFMLSSFSSLMDPLRMANSLSGRRLYKVRLASADGSAVVSSCGVPIEVDMDVRSLENVDMAFVVASRSPQRYGFASLQLWLRARAAEGVGICGIEAGSFVMGMAGILDGYSATIHWAFQEEFARRFIDTDVRNDRYVIDRNRATTAGPAPTVDFALAMIRSQHNMTLAMDVSSNMVYEQEHLAHDPQRVLSLGALHWREPNLAKAITMMDKNIETPLTIGEIADEVGLTERSLQRLFQRIVGKTPKTFYRELRLEAARRLLSRTDWPLAEIAAACGFGSRAAFSRAYKEHYQETPGQLRIWRVTW